ncbi:MAG: efflux RND transporter permease subunit [Deltaproteobacteria bacterium]|nr:efflux RND transporter permease subunit [Deltaproteobacteria bacterium]MBI3388845.1 efflux RND transporter permease subunit [Deltaproteobacteria bacterium]
MWLTLLAFRNAIAILMLSLAIVVLGWVSLQRLPVDLFPHINLPIVQVGTVYKGAGVKDMEKSVTYPIEKAVSSVSGVEHVESRSKQGISVVQVWFNWGANVDAGEVEVIQKIQGIIGALPTGVQQPFVVKFDLSNIPVLLVTLTGEGYDEKQLYDIAYNVVEPQLEHLPHVAAASVEGGKIRQITINLDRDQLQAKGINIQDVVSAVADANLILASGDLKTGSLDYNVFTNNQFDIVKPMEDIVVQTVAGVPIHLKDLGTVTDSYATQTSIVRMNGQRAVYLRINKQPGSNTIEVIDAVKRALPNLYNLPKGLQLGTFFDQSIYIRQSIEALVHEALQGSGLAFLVILIFLQSFTSTFIISLAIPLSVLMTFIFMYFGDQSLNVFTLGGLALAVGRLVDDSIVELENINRHLAMGKSRKQAALDAAREVAMPILASTVTTIVVFFPVVFLVGAAKLLFVPLTLTISMALVASFWISRTVTPLLCARLMRAHDERPRGRLARAGAAFFDGIDDRYQTVLAWALHHRATVIFTTVAIFAGSLLLLPVIGTEFFPVTDESQFRMIVKAPVGTRVEDTDRLVERIEAAVKDSIPAGYHKATVSSIGLPSTTASIYSPNTGPHSSNIQIELVDPQARDQSTEEIVANLRAKVASQFPGVAIYFDPGGIVKRILNFGSAAPVDVEVLGYDLHAARDLTQQLRGVMANMNGLADIQVTREEDYPELDVVVDREKAALLGLSERQIATSVLFSLSSNVSSGPSLFTDPITGNEYNIVAQLADRFRDDPSDLENLVIRADHSTPILLKSVASVQRGSGPVELDRKYEQRIVHLTANPAGRDLGSLSEELDRSFDQLKLPAGFEVHLGGQTKQQREAFQSLRFSMLVALMLVYMVLAAQFRSLLDPLIIMFSVPLGLTGVLWALFLSHTTLSTTSFMGVIMMVGIVVSNGVLLVDYTNVLRRRGMELHEAVITGGRTRLRPILMTTLTTIFGLLPMALGWAVGSETNAPLARAVLGGLSVSTVLTLVFVPTLYTVIEERFHREIRAEED